MDRNFLVGSAGEAVNALLAGFGYNFRRIIAWLRRHWRVLCILIAASLEESKIAVAA